MTIPIPRLPPENVPASGFFPVRADTLGYLDRVGLTPSRGDDLSLNVGLMAEEANAWAGKLEIWRAIVDVLLWTDSGEMRAPTVTPDHTREWDGEVRLERVSARIVYSEMRECAGGQLRWSLDVWLMPLGDNGEDDARKPPRNALDSLEVRLYDGAPARLCRVNNAWVYQLITAWNRRVRVRAQLAISEL